MAEEFINDYIRRKIKERREELEMSQDELAKSSGFADKTGISKIERGVVKVDVNKLKSIADALGVAPQYFFPEEEGELTEIDENEAFRNRMKEEYGVLFDLVDKADAKQRDQIEQIVKAIVPEDDWNEA